MVLKLLDYLDSSLLDSIGFWFEDPSMGPSIFGFVRVGRRLMY